MLGLATRRRPASPTWSAPAASPEWAYDRTSAIGHLDKALDEAQAKRWTVVEVKNDWKVI